MMMLLAGLALPTFAQPQAEPPPAGEALPDAVPSDAQALRRFLERRLEQNRETQQGLERAIQRLERGDSPQQVLRELDTPGARALEEWRRRGDDPFNPSDPRDRSQRGNRPMGPRPDPRGGAAPGADRAGDARRLLELLRTERPDLFEAIEGVRRTDPRAAERLGERMFPRLREAADERPRDEELFRLRLREMASTFGVMRATRAFKQAQKDQSPDAPQLREQLRAALAAAFDDRLAVQEREATVHERRLAALREDVQQRRQQRDQLLEQGLARIEAGPQPPPAPEAPPTPTPQGP